MAATNWGYSRNNNRNSGMNNSSEMTQDMLERQNQNLTEKLGSKVARLKDLAMDIESETKDSNRYLGGMDADFDSSEGLLTGSIKRLNHMVSSGKSNYKFMCYLILILVGLFIVIFYLFSWLRPSS